MSLRLKIALSLALTAVAVAAAIGLLVHLRTADTQLDTARRTLDAQFQSLLARQAEGQDAGLTVGPVPGPLSREITTRPVRATYLDGGTLWAATTLGGKTVSLARPYHPEQAQLAALDRTLLTSGALATVAACLAGIAVATGLSRRIRHVSRTAATIASGDLTARVFPPPPVVRPSEGAWQGDEVVAVGRALDRMADALQARLEAERRVTADIAHELRTPVTGLMTAAELLPPGRPAELVRDRAAVLGRLVEDILEVARLDAHTERPALERRLLSALTRRAITAAHAHADPVPAPSTAEPGHTSSEHPDLSEAASPVSDGAGGGVRLVVVRDVEVETDPRRVERVLANLVANAVRHGRPPVTVTVDGMTVRVEDHGQGFPADMLAVLREHGPQRFASGASARGTGVGLGLTIAAGQARMLGADLEFGDTGTGAEVTLRLPGTSSHHR
ncbi:sensor histidine kinase [Nonomuraea sp. NPDC050540]|uniref:sensor histidine kinase n=1 Tax=Nonomuraea sp. NPDC050540 TaxID=3364367 RepID=UPI0037B60729